ncbi:PP2C family protein-serine/threonine phosphatase [Polyangium jinanense]|uniref:SpoIIE family protein phosphatase n=1 Tax=Polyangium jinanense TaxID=2829994 RepID=A0A9X4ASZ9_9BACT|nr:SpoIIE family protein phosphatase [Polyangium jinanense]MDC3955411.1 SpoIIE family protein phosphatase [Polyangium jinanense]MDC3981712.1 SpoIIE family protein phosphatase [Polyangium jinanense]
MPRSLALHAAARTRMSTRSFASAYGENDDRWRIDERRGLFLVADASGPTYGGYYAPFGVDPGLAALAEALDGDGGEDRLRAALWAANSTMRAMEDRQEEVRKAVLQRNGEDRLHASLEAADAVRDRQRWPHRVFSHHATSCTALHAWGENRMSVAQVGVCRVYRIRGRTIEQLLRDHNLRTALEEQGYPTDLLPETKQISTRMLGHLQGPEQIDPRTVEVEPGDCFVLCTDGLWSSLAEERIRDIVVETTPSPADVAEALLRAVQGPDADDTTVVVIVAR